MVDIEAQLDQVNNMAVFGVSSGGYCRHDGLEDTNRGGLISISGGIINPVGFELIDEASVQSGVSLRIRGLSRVGKAI